MTKTKAGRRSPAWFALADTEHCRLLCCRQTEQGTPHVDEHGAIENTAPEHEHLRPQTGDGMTHDVEENERRFAGKIVAWLKEQAGACEIDHFKIFAAPRMLGTLRKVAPGSLKGHLEMLQGDLMRLNVGELANHPMIRDMVSVTPAN